MAKLATRLSEHRRTVRVCDSNFKIARHANQFGHNMDFDQATIVDKAADYHKRLFLEAWHSRRDQIVGNEHTEIPRLAQRSRVLIVMHISKYEALKEVVAFLFNSNRGRPKVFGRNVFIKFLVNVV